jgi:hypothetical protein
LPSSSTATGRRRAPFQEGDELVMGGSSGGERVWAEERWAVLYRAARCTVHSVRRVRGKVAAAGDWRRRAVGYVLARRCRRLDASARRWRGEKRRRAGGRVVCQLLDAKTGRGIGVGVHRGGLWLVRERSLGWCCSVVRVADRRERPGPGREVTDVAVATAACLVTTGGRRAGVSDGE